MLTSFKRYKSLTLLSSLMLLILVYPFFEMSRVGSVIYTLLFTTTLLSGVYAISYDVRYIAVGILLVAPILICHWSNFILNSDSIEIIQRICTTVFMIYTLVALLRRIITAPRVGLNEIFGAISAYAMIGIVFGFFYLLIEKAAPGSFALHGSPADVASFVYFSFVALSTAGFGDITAVAPFARAIVVIELVLGVTYVAVLIGRLINVSHMTEKKEEGLALLERRENEKQAGELLAAPLLLKQRPLGLTVACVMLNYAASAVVMHLQLPFFLDSMGTSLAVLLGGWRTGAVTALLYHLIISWFHWGWTSWVWLVSSLAVAGLTMFFDKKGWVRVDKAAHLAAAGIFTGFINGLLAQLIIFLAHMPPYQGTLPVYKFFLKVTSSQTFAALAEKMFVEIADKTISLMVAAVIVFLLHDLLANYKKNLEQKDSPGNNF